MAISPAASGVSARARLLRHPLVVGVLAGVVGILASLVLPSDLPFQAGNLIVFPMLAVAGPLGGAIGGAIGGLSSPIFFVAVPVSLVGGLLVGWGYPRFVWPQTSSVGRLVAWAILVLIVDVISSLIFATLLPMLDPTTPGFPDSLGVIVGFAGPSTAFDVVGTTLVMAILPERLRQPLA